MSRHCSRLTARTAISPITGDVTAMSRHCSRLTALTSFSPITGDATATPCHGSRPIALTSFSPITGDLTATLSQGSRPSTPARSPQVLGRLVWSATDSSLLTAPPFASLWRCSLAEAGRAPRRRKPDDDPNGRVTLSPRRRRLAAQDPEPGLPPRSGHVWSSGLRRDSTTPLARTIVEARPLHSAGPPPKLGHPGHSADLCSRRDPATFADVDRRGGSVTSADPATNSRRSRKPNHRPVVGIRRHSRDCEPILVGEPAPNPVPVTPAAGPPAQRREWTLRSRPEAPPSASARR
jgi:hypothetical protein